MCKKSTYKRFLNIYNYMQKYDSSGLIKNAEFNTKLGERKISSYILGNKDISFIYFEKDETPLFILNIKSNGRIRILKSKIGQPEIFLAIYEIEQIINKEKHKIEVDNFLEKLFKNTENKFNVNLFGFTMYR